MDISKARENYVFTTKIELSENDYVVLREPTTLQLRDLGKDESKTFEVLYEIFDSCLIDHSFVDGDQKAATKDVVALLKDSGSTFTHILQGWLESLPLKKTKPEN